MCDRFVWLTLILVVVLWRIFGILCSLVMKFVIGAATAMIAMANDSVFRGKFRVYFQSLNFNIRVENRAGNNVISPQPRPAAPSQA